jgi:hypothetical protein
MRRDFLKWCACAGLGLTVPLRLPRTARAGEKQDLPPYEGPYYVVFNAAGGWDTTYLMDPKGVGGINRLYQEGDVLTHGNHRFAPTAQHKQGGMSNEDFYAEFGDELLVLNGLDYSVNNHSPCSRYMATGKLDSLAYPTFAALVAACQGPACPLSFLTFGNYSATGNLVAMSRIPYLPSLKRIANADAIDGNTRAPYHDEFALTRIERALGEQRAERSAQRLLPRQERAENMLYAAQVNSKALARVTPHIPTAIPKQRLAQQAEIALASFKAGVCVSANLSIGQFDSHANNDADQMKLIPEFLEGIAYFIHRAEELKIRDKLVVIVQSAEATGSSAQPTRSSSPCPSIRRRSVPARTPASAYGRNTYTKACGSLPASPTIPTAENFRSASSPGNNCGACGASASEAGPRTGQRWLARFHSTSMAHYRGPPNEKR